jgi:hypothetical protein
MQIYGELNGGGKKGTGDESKNTSSDRQQRQHDAFDQPAFRVALSELSDTSRLTGHTAPTEATTAAVTTATPMILADELAPSANCRLKTDSGTCSQSEWDTASSSSTVTP